MTAYADLLLVFVLILDLWVLATGRLVSVVRAVALQGAALALLPLAFADLGSPGVLVHLGAIAAGALVLKAFLIPRLIRRAMRRASIRREVEPTVSLHVSVLLGALLIGVAFWMASALTLPRPAPTPLLVPVALATVFVGFLLLVLRRKAITQVLGYLVLENGIYVFGQTLATRMPLVVELGILLDVLVGVFVMGIAIHNISREFDDIDVETLATLRD